MLEETVGDHQDRFAKFELQIQELKNQNDTLHTQIQQVRAKYTNTNEALKRLKIQSSHDQVRVI